MTTDEPALAAQLREGSSDAVGPMRRMNHLATVKNQVCTAEQRGARLRHRGRDNLEGHKRTPTTSPWKLNERLSEVPHAAVPLTMYTLALAEKVKATARCPPALFQR